MPRTLEPGQVWVRMSWDCERVIARYRVRSVEGRNAVCDMLDSKGNVKGLRVFLPDSFLFTMQQEEVKQNPYTAHLDE